MLFLVLHVVCSFLLDLVHVLTRSDHDRAMELVLFRQQLRLYERKATQPRPSRWEMVALAAIAARLPDLSRVCLVFTPACAGQEVDPLAFADRCGRAASRSQVYPGQGGLPRALMRIAFSASTGQAGAGVASTR